MTNPWVTGVFVPSSIGSAKFSNTNAIVVNLTDPIRMERSQEPSTWSAAPVTPWNLIPVLRKSVIPRFLASVARNAVHAAPESTTARMDTCSVTSPPATCSFARKQPDLAACRYTLSDASAPTHHGDRVFGVLWRSVFPFPDQWAVPCASWIYHLIDLGGGWRSPNRRRL